MLQVVVESYAPLSMRLTLSTRLSMVNCLTDYWEGVCLLLVLGY